MKFSPKLVTIFSDEFSVNFSPILVIFFGKWRNRWVVKWWSCHQSWWQYFLMNFLPFFRKFWWFFLGNEKIGEWLSDKIFTKNGDNIFELIQTIFGHKNLRQYFWTWISFDNLITEKIENFINLQKIHQH